MISKKRSKPGTDVDADKDFEMISVDNAATASMEPENANDVCHGASHGYWKNLLNLVVFAAHDPLMAGGDFDSLLNQQPDNSNAGKRKRWEKDQGAARELRRRKKQVQNERVQHRLDSDPIYQPLPSK